MVVAHCISEPPCRHQFHGCWVPAGEVHPVLAVSSVPVAVSVATPQTCSGGHGEGGDDLEVGVVSTAVGEHGDLDAFSVASRGSVGQGQVQMAQLRRRCPREGPPRAHGTWLRARDPVVGVLASSRPPPDTSGVPAPGPRAPAVQASSPTPPWQSSTAKVRPQPMSSS
jgi:hypothetical protein